MYVPRRDQADIATKSHQVSREDERPLVPGEVVLGNAVFETHAAKRRRVRVRVANTSSWPVAITSHFHFFEINRMMRFNRSLAFGMHLDVPAGASERWVPGQTKEVDLVEYGGDRAIFGFNGFVNARIDADSDGFEELRAKAVRGIVAAGYENGDP